MMTNASNNNELWTEILVDEFARAGLRAVCISPGSRSTPLTLAFSAHPQIRAYVLVDERSTAFFALGLALGRKEPVAILTTSGTATANLFPAVIEAEQSNIPLILLTADRPPELRQSGANQTIDQIRMYGSHVKWSLEIPIAEDRPSDTLLRYLRTTCDRALALAKLSPAGPVHLNIPFRKPFTFQPSVPSGSKAGSGELRPDSKIPVQAPTAKITIPNAVPSGDEILELAELISARPCGLILLGPRSNAEEFIEPLAEVAKSSGYPIFADPLSGARFAGGLEHNVLVCGGYTTFLQSPDVIRTISAQIIIHVGAALTSGSLENFINTQ